MLRSVSRVDQSPMNPKRWCITMDCGHETWVTRERGKPKASGKAFCEKCSKDEQKSAATEAYWQAKQGDDYGSY